MRELDCSESMGTGKSKYRKQSLKIHILVGIQTTISYMLEFAYRSFTQREALLRKLIFLSKYFLFILRVLYKHNRVYENTSNRAWSCTEINHSYLMAFLQIIFFVVILLFVE